MTIVTRTFRPARIRREFRFARALARRPPYFACRDCRRRCESSLYAVTDRAIAALSNPANPAEIPIA